MPGRILRPASGIPAFRRRMGGGPIAIPSEIPAGSIQPSQPGALGPEQGQLVRLPGGNFFPAGSTPVDVPGDADVASGASGTIITYIVPDTQRCRIVGIGFSADDETALAFMSWSIRLGPDSIPGYTLSPAAIGSLQYLADISLVVGSSATINVVVTMSTLAVATYHLVARMRGWLYSDKEL